MRYRLSVLVTLFLFSLAITAMQPAPRPIPPFQGDGNPGHDGQPSWCQNHSHGGYQSNCHCYGMGTDCEGLPRKRDDVGPETSHCGTYCRHACRCVNPCTS